MVLVVAIVVSPSSGGCRSICLQYFVLDISVVDNSRVPYDLWWLFCQFPRPNTTKRSKLIPYIAPSSRLLLYSFESTVVNRCPRACVPVGFTESLYSTMSFTRLVALEIHCTTAIVNWFFYTMSLWDSINESPSAEEVTVISACAHGCTFLRFPVLQVKYLRFPYPYGNALSRMCFLEEWHDFWQWQKYPNGAEVYFHDLPIVWKDATDTLFYLWRSK